MADLEDEFDGIDAELNEEGMVLLQSDYWNVDCRRWSLETSMYTSRGLIQSLLSLSLVSLYCIERFLAEGVDLLRLLIRLDQLQ